MRQRVPLPAVLLVILWFAGAGLASRNSGGTYSLPAGNPVVSGTTITSTWANTTLNDIKTEITNSLDRQGRGGMLAPLQLVAGTVSAPGLAFSAEPGSGAYRAGAGDWRLTALGTAVLKLQSAVVTTLVPLTVTGRTTTTDLTVTGTSEDIFIATTATNSYGLRSEGNGTGVGVEAIGGATNATGLEAYGGGATGTAIYGEAAASGKGAQILGGATAGNALEATAQGGNSTGVIGRGFGSGSGGTFYTAAGASATDGTAALNGVGLGNNTVGIWGVGTGIYPGVRGQGASTAAGVEATAGTSATGAARYDAIDVTNGDIDLSAVANPNSNVSITDRLTPKNIVKAWGKFSLNAGTVTILDGFNIDTAAVTNTLGTATPSEVAIDFAGDFASNVYGVVVTQNSGGIGCLPATASLPAPSAGQVTVRFLSTISEVVGTQTSPHRCGQSATGTFDTWTGTVFTLVAFGEQ